MPLPNAQAVQVAVIIPCFDDGATVADAVRSAHDGGLPCEVVVVDDGSTDPLTLRVLDELAVGEVTVLRQPNRGVAAARTAGLRATRAPLVLPLDADDVLVPGALALLADALRGSPGTSAAWGWYERMGSENTVQPTAPTLDPWQVSHQNDLPATALFRRETLEAAGGWSDVTGFEDWDLWMSLAERGVCGIGVPRVVYRYRRAGDRRLEQDTQQEETIMADLLARHPGLVAARRANWRDSQAPLALRLTLPVVARLPLARGRRRLLAGTVAHLAHGRGVRLLLQRIRQQAA